MRKIRRKKNNNKLIILLLFLILVMGIIIIIMFKNNHNSNLNSSYDEQEMDKTAGEYHNTANNNGKNVIMPGWNKLSIKANTTNITSGVDFYNPKENEGYYYLKFQLIVNGEVLYESGLVAPDKHIQEITLSKPLTEGKYDAIVFIQPYKWDKKTPTNNGQVRVNLEVSS